MCENVELLIATTDDNLYKDKWLWSGILYFAINCLPDGQISVSDKVLPNINLSSYTPLIDTPQRWDYCKSRNCNLTSQTLQLVFTFKPDSTDPKDFLQYVINVNGIVNDSPTHSISDMNGRELYLNIVEISKLIRKPYIEIWISRGNIENHLQTSLTLTSKIHMGKTESYFLPIIIVLLMLLILVILTGYLILR